MKCSVQTVREQLLEGEILRYERDGYSRYDGMTVYMFRDDSNRSREWDLDDSEDLESWRDVFEEVA